MEPKRGIRTPWTALPPLLSLTLLWSCSGGHSGNSSPPVSNPAQGPPLSITATTLPLGRVGHAYSASLSAQGGTAPLTWSVTGGSLPAGLALAAGTGLVSGTPTASADAVALTFTVTDSGSTRQTQSETLRLSINPADITVSASPARAGITRSQTLALAATTNDLSGVTWSVAAGAGTLSATSTASGGQVTYSPPTAAGVYTVTATSVTDATQQATVTIGVTDLAGVYTYHNDVARDGANTSEYALTSANVNTVSFGKLFSCTVDAAVYAQPLWVANLSVDGAPHNVLFIATSNNSLYAFDADTSPCLQLWHVSLVDTAHGGTTGEITNRDFGVIGTPVIDPASGTLYAVSRTLNAAATTAYHRLHAIDTVSGSERAGSPVTITASYGSGATAATFDPMQHLQRTALALANGTVYLAFGSVADLVPWYGWMMGYAYSAQNKAFTQVALFNATPALVNGEHGGGIWMAGGAPALDENGNLFVITGNGSFNASTVGAPGPNYGDCFLRLNPQLQVSAYFSPTDQDSDDANDLDFGSGGATILLTPTGGPIKHLTIGGGKDGVLYVLNGDTLGGAGDNFAVQTINLNGGNFSHPAFWNNTLYIGAVGGSLQAYTYSTSTGLFTTTWTTESKSTYAWPGANPSVSSAGASGDGVVWAIDSSANCTLSRPCGPAVLHAYSAADLGNELWNSSMSHADAAGNAVKFTVPVIANGKVYVGTRGNNTGGAAGSTTISGEVDVYGLKPN